MKKLIFILGLSSSVLAMAQTAKKAEVLPPPGKAAVGDHYGAKLKNNQIKNAVSTAELSKELNNQKKIENAVVKGKVTDVCDKKGCWLTLETDNNEKFFVKMKDYAFFVPTALKGKTVVLDGVAELKTTSVAELKHYAEDAKKPQSEIDAITQPKEEVRFLANGIEVVK